jgi:two-component system OmpR family response regulator
MSEPRLLIIEDDKKIVELVSRTAQEDGFTVRASCDFAEIPSVFDEFKPDAIILDIIMPGMDGFEILDFLHKRNSSTRIVVLSGRPDYRPMASRMAEGLELAIIETVAKPFRLSELRLALDKIKDSLPKHPSSEAAA